MKPLLIIFALALSVSAQPRPSISVGTDAPASSLCDRLTVGNVYVRSENAANGPINVMRCTQTGALAYAWHPISHLVVATLPDRCAVGDVAFRTGVSAGSNLYGCTATDTWTAQAGGGTLSLDSLTGDCTGSSTAITCTKLNSVAVSATSSASTIVQRNASSEVIAANTVATGKTPMATDTVLVAAQEPAHTGDITNSVGSIATTLAAQYKVRTCEIIMGDPSAGASALTNDNDMPAVCSNLTGATMTITEVKCLADSSTGSPTVLPIITGGASTSILSGGTPLACGNGVFGSAGTLNGTPTQADGETIDGNISTAGGTAKVIIIRIKRTL